ncbi:MAG: FprA family A-type flavoprotein [Gemmiger sp.]|nr:FprA family A-type flavoprotein [Gemmiger sp.]
MYTTRKIAQDTIYVGASDRRLAKFENLFPIPRGVSYNNYLILDEKTVLLDTADAAVSGRFLENVAHALGGRALDYIVVNHMEPDHAATLGQALNAWPGAQLVCNAKTLPMLRMYFPGCEAAVAGALLVKEGDTLALGSHTLHFVMAPMVHWPEVMMAFDDATGVLYSADAFGTFGALGGNIFADELDFARDWLDDARRYYANIVGKYGVPVQAVLKKAATLPIRMLAPLHGPIWRKDLPWFIAKYDQWSRCAPEDKAVVVLYGSMYGNTENAAEALATRLADKGLANIALYDLSVTDNSVAMAECFRASHIVLASPTYNGGLYLPMEALLNDMKALALHDRVFALIENGSWAPVANKLMADKLAELKNATILDTRLTVRGALADAQSESLDALADAILGSM